jgi:alcohol dehydrogenase
VRYNSKNPAARQAYAELASAPEIACVSDGVATAVEALIARLESLLNLAQFPRSLEECGVERAQVKMLADEAAKQWTAAFNPQPVTAKDLERIFEAAFQPRGDGDGKS